MGCHKLTYQNNTELKIVSGKKTLTTNKSNLKGSSNYLYGFNGKEKDTNLGGGTHYDYGFRIYNPRIAKFLSVDPLTKSYPMLTPYQFASNRPIDGIDLDGLEFYQTTSFVRITFTPKVTYKNEIIIVPSLSLNLTSSDTKGLIEGVFAQNGGKSPLRKTIGIVNSPVKAARKLNYSSLKLIGKLASSLQIANELYGAYERGQEIGQANSAQITNNLIARGAAKASWVVDVISVASEYGVIASNDPKYLEDLANFALDGTPPMKASIRPGSQGRTIDFQKYNRLVLDFTKLENFYNDERSKEVPIIRVHTQEIRGLDMRKVKAIPYPDRKKPN